MSKLSSRAIDALRLIREGIIAMAITSTPDIRIQYSVEIRKLLNIIEDEVNAS